MTPEQIKTVRGFIDRLIIGVDASDANVAAIALSDLDAELSHYVRIPATTPAGERRCGGCVKYSVCMHAHLSDGEDWAATCKEYSDGSLPEGIAGLVRTSVAARKLGLEWMLPSSDGGLAQLEALNEAQRARVAATDALSAAELAMAGVTDELRPTASEVLAEDADERGARVAGASVATKEEHG